MCVNCGIRIALSSLRDHMFNCAGGSSTSVQADSDSSDEDDSLCHGPIVTGKCKRK